MEYLRISILISTLDVEMVLVAVASHASQMRTGKWRHYFIFLYAFIFC